MTHSNLGQKREWSTWPAYEAALGVAYGAGLRVSEGANLKILEIDGKRMMLRVEQGEFMKV